MGKPQKSKRAREIKKQAQYAGLHRLFSHPSHNAGTKRMIRRYKSKETGVTLIELMVSLMIMAILATCAIACYVPFLERVRSWGN